MTSPIKPPGGAPPKIAPTETPDVTRSDAKAEAFATAMDSPAVASSSVTATSPLVQALKAGEIDGPGAVDAMIAGLLEGPMAAGLDEAGRAALETHLRDSLADDPNLAQLAKDLDRAG